MDAPWLVLTLTLFAGLLSIKAEGVLKVQKFTCTTHDNATIQDLKCYSKPINRSLTLINASVFVKRPVSSVFINCELFKRTVVTYKPFLLNVTENFCHFLGTKRGGIYVRSLMKLHLPYTNLNHSCPYSGLVYARNMPVGVDTFVSIWPPGEYRLDLRFMENSKLFAVLHLFFEIK